MESTFKNIILAGIGALAYSYEKGSAIIEDLVRKGDITVNQGKELSQELKKTINKDKAAREPLSTLTTEALKDMLTDMGFVTGQDLEGIRTRLDKLEGKKDTL